jgi:DNA mismatch repair protein MutL
LLPVAAEAPFERAGLPEPPPWRKDPGQPPRIPGSVRLAGFYSKPELQKLNRNSIYIFINKRLIRDRLLLHAITESYRNVIPPTSFPVVLLFLEMPPEEVDVNVHPAKTEVRFRQQSRVHDFVRDSLRTALIHARPAAGFLAALDSQPSASPSLMPPAASPLPGAPDRDSFGPSAPLPPDSDPATIAEAEPFRLTPRVPQSIPGSLPFDGRSLPEGQPPEDLDSQGWSRAADALFAPGSVPPAGDCSPNPNGATAYASDSATAAALVEAEQAANSLNRLGSLKPLGQLRESFILAAGDDGLWIIDQHVAHERVLFEKILRDRQVERVQRQRLLMPMLVELKPEQMVVFARIAEELESNGFEVEPFGPQTLAVKAAPVGLEGAALERMLAEVIDQSSADSGEPSQNEELNRLRSRIAASIACHSAIKINTALDPKRIEWLLLELAKTSHPTSCPHGRPIALLYSWKDIQRAFHRI